MKRNLIIAVVILAIMLASGGVVYAATHKLEQTIQVSVNVTAAPIQEFVYSDENLTQKVTTLSFTYPKGEFARTTVYISGNISADTIEAFGDNLPGDMMVSGIARPPLASGVIPIEVTAMGGDEGNHTGVLLKVNGHGGN